MYLNFSKTTKKKYFKFQLIFIWIVPTKYLLNIKIYLFDTKNINLI